MSGFKEYVSNSLVGSQKNLKSGDLKHGSMCPCWKCSDAMAGTIYSVSGDGACLNCGTQWRWAEGPEFCPTCFPSTNPTLDSFGASRIIETVDLKDLPGYGSLEELRGNPEAVELERCSHGVSLWQWCERCHPAESVRMGVGEFSVSNRDSSWLESFKRWKVKHGYTDIFDVTGMD